MPTLKNMSADYRKGCYSTSDLLARGWTRRTIKKHLGEPDHIHKFGRGRVAYLYVPIRVHAMEERLAANGWKKAKRKREG